MKKTTRCKNCETQTEHRLYKTISTSGTVLVGWVCLRCNSWTRSKTGGYWISHTLLKQHGVDIDSLPVKQDGPGIDPNQMTMF
jgi:hypothetical protein